MYDTLLFSEIWNKKRDLYAHKHDTLQAKFP
jgi:hypothetical protein